MLLAFTVSSANNPTLRGAFLQTAHPLDRPVLLATDGVELGQYVDSFPVIGVQHARLTVSWREDDGLIGVFSPTPGVFIRSAELYAEPQAAIRISPLRAWPYSVPQRLGDGLFVYAGLTQSYAAALDSNAVPTQTGYLAQASGALASVRPESRIRH